MTTLPPDAPGWRAQGVIPVLTLTGGEEQAVRTAATLAAAGLPIIEVTLRTPAALPAIRAIARHCPEVVVGAGSLLSPADLAAAVEAGAAFLVAPGQTDALLEAGLAAPRPFIPGAQTPSELMRAHACGYRTVKVFPAQSLGGAKALAGLLAPFPRLSVMPTGGITSANLAEYLALPAVVCCGGSWMASADDIAAGRLDRITALAQAAAALARERPKNTSRAP